MKGAERSMMAVQKIRLREFFWYLIEIGGG